jgi:hypothetical protein
VIIGSPGSAVPGDSQPKPGGGEQCCAGCGEIIQCVPCEFCGYPNEPHGAGQIGWRNFGNPFKPTHVSVDGAEFAVEKPEPPEARGENPPRKLHTCAATWNPIDFSIPRPQCEACRDGFIGAQPVTCFGCYTKWDAILALEARLATACGRVNELGAQLTAAEARLAERESCINTLANALDNNDAEGRGLRSDIHGLHKQIADLDRNLVAFQRRDDRLAELLEGEPEAKRQAPLDSRIISYVERLRGAIAERDATIAGQQLELAELRVLADTVRRSRLVNPQGFDAFYPGITTALAHCLGRKEA